MNMLLNNICHAVSAGYKVSFEPYGDGVVVRLFTDSIEVTHRAIACSLTPEHLGRVISTLPRAVGKELERMNRKRNDGLSEVQVEDSDAN